MMARSSRRQHISLLVVALILSATVVTAFGHGLANRVAHSACSISETTNWGNWMAAAVESSISNLEGSSADLWNYNPDPVWNNVSFWTMAVRSGEDRWTQVGWMEYSATNNEEKVFLQIKNTSTQLVTKWYHTSNGGEWTDSASDAVNPTASKKYEQYKYDSKWWVRYDGGTQFQLSTSWSPDHVQVAGETTSYEAVAGTDKGHHAPGDKSNKIQANNSKKNVSGIWSDTSLTVGTPTGNHDSDGSNNDGDGMRTWDKRCSS